MSCCGAFAMPVELTPGRLEGARPGSGEPARPARPITGRDVLFCMIAFFAVIIAVNIVMMVLAIRTMPGLETKSAYEASQRFNRELDKIAAQDGRAWQVDIALGDAAKGIPFAIEARDRDGRPLAGLDVIVRFERPADQRFDQRIALEAHGAGRYLAARPALAPGQWIVTAEIARGGEVMFVSRRKLVLAE